MRLALVSLIALSTAAASAMAQPAAAPPASPPPAASAQPADQSPPEPPATPPAAAAPPAPLEPIPPAPPPPPPPPPTPPTDATAIGILSVLQSICIPAANGGVLNKLAKTAGYRKAGDNWQMRQRDYTLTIEPQGSNPNQCHVDVTHPVDQEAPGRPIIVALNDWAAITHGWSLYRNDKNTMDGTQFTTRSWQHDADGKSESVVFTTTRHADGSPMQHGADVSQLIYAVVNSSG